MSSAKAVACLFSGCERTGEHTTIDESIKVVVPVVCLAKCPSHDKQFPGCIQEAHGGAKLFVLRCTTDTE